ncbi:hypothetical protein [Paenarthrobacter sp. FR1]|uniref:hypothetical protein n=1 Tax=Paenarthrobacter sp. FR1 TaxID=3439548 RepID=UPI003DA37A7C
MGPALRVWASRGGVEQAPQRRGVVETVARSVHPPEEPGDVKGVLVALGGKPGQ